MGQASSIEALAADNQCDHYPFLKSQLKQHPNQQGNLFSKVAAVASSSSGGAEANLGKEAASESHPRMTQENSARSMGMLASSASDLKPRTYHIKEQIDSLIETYLLENKSLCDVDNDDAAQAVSSTEEKQDPSSSELEPDNGTVASQSGGGREKVSGSIMPATPTEMLCIEHMSTGPDSSQIANGNNMCSDNVQTSGPGQIGALIATSSESDSDMTTSSAPITKQSDDSHLSVVSAKNVPAGISMTSGQNEDSARICNSPVISFTTADSSGDIRQRKNTIKLQTLIDRVLENSLGDNSQVAEASSSSNHFFKSLCALDSDPKEDSNKSSSEVASESEANKADPISRIDPTKSDNENSPTQAGSVTPNGKNALENFKTQIERAVAHRFQREILQKDNGADKSTIMDTTMRPDNSSPSDQQHSDHTLKPIGHSDTASHFAGQHTPPQQRRPMYERRTLNVQEIIDRVIKETEAPSPPPHMMSKLPVTPTGTYQRSDYPPVLSAATSRQPVQRHSAKEKPPVLERQLPPSSHPLPPVHYGHSIMSGSPSKNVLFDPSMRRIVPPGGHDPPPDSSYHPNSISPQSAARAEYYHHMAGNAASRQPVKSHNISLNSARLQAMPPGSGTHSSQCNPAVSAYQYGKPHPLESSSFNVSVNHGSMEQKPFPSQHPHYAQQQHDFLYNERLATKDSIPRIAVKRHSPPPLIRMNDSHWPPPHHRTSEFSLQHQQREAEFAPTPPKVFREHSPQINVQLPDSRVGTLQAPIYHQGFHDRERNSREGYSSRSAQDPTHYPPAPYHQLPHPASVTAHELPSQHHDHQQHQFRHTRPGPSSGGAPNHLNTNPLHSTEPFGGVCPALLTAPNGQTLGPVPGPRPAAWLGALQDHHHHHQQQQQQHQQHLAMVQQSLSPAQAQTLVPPTQYAIPSSAGHATMPVTSSARPVWLTRAAAEHPPVQHRMDILAAHESKFLPSPRSPVRHNRSPVSPVPVRPQISVKAPIPLKPDVLHRSLVYNDSSGATHKSGPRSLHGASTGSIATAGSRIAGAAMRARERAQSHTHTATVGGSEEQPLDLSKKPLSFSSSALYIKASSNRDCNVSPTSLVPRPAQVPVDPRMIQSQLINNPLRHTQQPSAKSVSEHYSPTANVPATINVEEISEHKKLMSPHIRHLEQSVEKHFHEYQATLNHPAGVIDPRLPPQVNAEIQRRMLLSSPANTTVSVSSSPASVALSSGRRTPPSTDEFMSLTSSRSANLSPITIAVSVSPVAGKEGIVSIPASDLRAGTAHPEHLRHSLQQQPQQFHSSPSPVGSRNGPSPLTLSPAPSPNSDDGSIQTGKPMKQISKHEPIQSLLGKHAPNDILYLICRLCGQTYGSPYGFRRHFRNQHGFEPQAIHRQVQTISETRSALQPEKDAGTSSIVPIHVPDDATKLNVQQQDSQGFTDILDERESAVLEVNKTASIKNVAPSNTLNMASSPHIINPTLDVPPLPSLSPHAGATNISKDTGAGTVTAEQLALKQKQRYSTQALDEEVAEERRFLSCQECGEKFQLNDFGLYKKHCRAHEKQRQGKLRTAVGDSLGLLTQDNQLQDPMFRPVNKRSYFCQSCNLFFTNAASLNQHLKVGHGEKTECSATSASSMTSSNDSISSIGTDTPLCQAELTSTYQCSGCDGVFAGWRVYTEHRQNCLELTPPASENSSVVEPLPSLDTRPRSVVSSVANNNNNNNNIGQITANRVCYADITMAANKVQSESGDKSDDVCGAGALEIVLSSDVPNSDNNKVASAGQPTKRETNDVCDSHIVIEDSTSMSPLLCKKKRPGSTTSDITPTVSDTDNSCSETFYRHKKFSRPLKPRVDDVGMVSDIQEPFKVVCVVSSDCSPGISRAGSPTSVTSENDLTMADLQKDSKTCIVTELALETAVDVLQKAHDSDASSSVSSVDGIRSASSLSDSVGSKGSRKVARKDKSLIGPVSGSESSNSSGDSANKSGERTDKISVTTAKHNLPFVWDRVTRSQTGRSSNSSRKYAAS